MVPSLPKVSVVELGEARSCLVSRSFWFIRKEGSQDERKIRAMEVKCVMCWGVRACPMF